MAALLVAANSPRALAASLIDDIEQGRERYRASLEREIAAYKALLVEVAYRTAGLALEELRRRDPHVPGRWSAAEWRAFLSEHVRSPATQAWGAEPAPDPLRAEVEKLRAQLAGLQEQNRLLLRQLADERTAAHRMMSDLRAQQESAAMAGGSVEPPALPAPVRTRPATRPRQVERGMPPSEPPALIDYAACAESARRVRENPPALPARWRDRLSYKQDKRLPRQLVALYLAARWRIALRIEIDAVLARIESVKPGGGSMSAMLDVLADTGLMAAERLAMALGRGEKETTSLIAWRLSQDGRELCRLLGWEPLENEYERILRRHEGARFPDHTLGILVVIYQARRRGYGLTVLPEVQGNAAPDLLLARGEERLYVEVELGDKERVAKWRNLVDLQGRVALVARNPDDRQRLIADCRNLGLAGCATDLLTLVREKEPGELWQELW